MSLFSRLHTRLCAYGAAESIRMATACAERRTFALWRLDPARQATAATRYEQINGPTWARILSGL